VSDVPDWSEVDIGATSGADPARTVIPERLRLMVLSGVDRGRELELTRGTYYIGKHPRCALVLRDEQVSRRHLELRIETAGVHARDLGSRNGSFFRGGKFSEIVVGTGAVLTIGKTELMLLSHDAPQPLLPSEAEAFGGLRGRSLPMRQTFTLLEKVAPTEALVLIEGETGTGKELTAEAIHAASARANGPLVVCDLSAVARGLLESELFGHAKGAFTGAQRDRAGAFESADGGTLFLDEVGELELELQPRLLRALERRQVSRVGETKPRSFDCRIIAATNRDLGEEVKAGRFREDLFHRLTVVRVRLPPLRERKEDLPLLVDALAAGRPVLPETMSLLGEYDWPGNVRELANTLARGFAMCSDGRPVAPADLGLHPEVRDTGGGIDDFHLSKERLIGEWEREFLRRLLATSGDNLSHAARASGLGRAHLYRLLKKYKME
jgi:two-component system, NtrC family, nitrogen regulation response regulator GlnG